MEQTTIHRTTECRRIATYLRTAASRTASLAFATRMIGVADELDEEAATLSPGTGARHQVTAARHATSALL